MDRSQHPAIADTKFELLRNRCMDAFSLMEEALVELLVAAGHAVTPCASLGQKIDAARKIKPCPRISKDNAKKLPALLLLCEAKIPERNDISHSRLRIVTMDGAAFACFANAGQDVSVSQSARLFTHKAISGLASETTGLAGDLRRVLNATPAPSQPPPSQAATTGP